MVEPDAESVLSQDQAGVRFEWGPAGAAHLAAESSCLVVVDVLSFTTAVSVAVGRGMAVYPYRWNDSGGEEFASAHGAELAVRRKAVDAEHPWSLSPVHLAKARVTPRLVLPSPNGSAIAAAATGTVVAGCLRNAAAVSAWIVGHEYGSVDRPAVVVASGERWPDGSLRPALEDALGAGAILDHLNRHRLDLSAESRAMATMYHAIPDVAETVRSCVSARQLEQAGYNGDVEMAVEIDTDETVPLLTNGAFRTPSVA